MNSILQKYQSTRQRTEALCSKLEIEDFVVQPSLFASPAKWNIAHTTWFFEEFILKIFLKDYHEFDSEFNFLFNSYYQTVGERIFRAERGNITRPSVKEVYAYRKHVDLHVSKLFENGISKEIYQLMELGINHEEQHQELLLTDLKFLFGQNPIFPVYDSGTNLVENTNTEAGFVKIEEGLYVIGHEGGNFAYDNESDQHKVFLHSFEIAKELVTNEDFIEFIDAGGYANFSYWLDEGWTWVNDNNIESPMYWHKIKENWYNYTLAGLRPVKMDAILSHVSYYEANAFAAWKKMRLPTEFEWEIASDHLDWGKRWEWTNSAYLPYPGFKIAEGAVGEYNGKFMMNQMVLRGASTATAKDHSRKTYRNFFHPHYQWQFSGIRLVK